MAQLVGQLLGQGGYLTLVFPPRGLLPRTTIENLGTRMDAGEPAKLTIQRG